MRTDINILPTPTFYGKCMSLVGFCTTPQAIIQTGVKIFHPWDSQDRIWIKLDMLMANRHLKSPRSLFRTSAHPTMVTLVNIMVINGWLPSFSFHVNRLYHSWDKAISDSDLETPRSRSWVWSKSCSHPSILSICFLFISHQTNNSWDTAISNFDLETSKVKIMSEVKGQVYILYAVSNPCTSFSFHINRTTHSWDMAK